MPSESLHDVASMVKKKEHHRSGRRRRGGRAPSSAAMGDAADEGMRAAFEEIQRFLETPLAELMGSEEERVEVEKLGARAAAAPAMARLRKWWLSWAVDAQSHRLAASKSSMPVLSPAALAAARKLSKPAVSTTCPTPWRPFVGPPHQGSWK